MKNITPAIIFMVIQLLFADAPTVQSNGIGTRALSFANTFVALADDFSAIYWNPAGLAFVPFREVQLSLDFLKNNTITTLDTTNTDISRQRFRFGNIGFLRAIPTTQGGMSMAFGFSSPILFDNQYSFQGWDQYLGFDSIPSSYFISIDTIITINDTTIDTTFDFLNKEELLYTDTGRTNTYGQLNMVSGAMGWQIAPNLGFGITLSLLLGKEYQNIRFKTFNSNLQLFDNYEEQIKRTFIGLDIRAGLLYKPKEWLSFGVSFTAPQYLKFEEKYQYKEMYYGFIYKDNFSGKMTSSFKGSFGGAIRLPYLLFTTQTNFRTPMADIYGTSSKQYWKGGISFGIEVPVPSISTFFRGGYSWNELDIFPYKVDYNDDDETSFEPNLSLNRGCHLVTGGLSIFLNDAFVIETAYSFSFKEFTTKDSNWLFNLKEKQTRHRIQCSFSLHY